MSQNYSVEPHCPIYEYIKSNTENGRLQEGFEIPWLRDTWVPGGRDGIALNHRIPIEFTENMQRDQDILKALKLMSSNSIEDNLGDVFSIFEELDNQESIVRLFNPVINTISAHQQELNLNNLLKFGDYLISYGVSLLAVKIGMTILAAFNAPFVEEIAMELGVYDEFTYYAARILRQDYWENGNIELFNLAKNVNGWGRIHAVEWLIPATQEIRDWLLYEGMNNTVNPQYSAYVCLIKSDVEERLDSLLSIKEFNAIERIIWETVIPGPCEGVPNGDRILPKFIARAKEFTVNPRVFRFILYAADEYSLDPDTIRAAKELARS